MKHLQYIKFLGSSQILYKTTRDKCQYWWEFTTWGYVYWGDIKWTCKQAKKIKKYFLIMCTIKETWFDKQTSKGVQHLNWDLNDKKEQTKWKPTTDGFRQRNGSKERGCKDEMNLMCSRDREEGTVLLVLLRAEEGGTRGRSQWSLNEVMARIRILLYRGSLLKVSEQETASYGFTVFLFKNWSTVMYNIM